MHHHNNNTDDDDNDNISNNNNNGNNNDNNNNNNNNREKRKTKLLSCYLKAMKELKKGYRERMHNLWNEMRMFEIEEQHLACQVRNIFNNRRLKEIEIRQSRKEIEKDEIAQKELIQLWKWVMEGRVVQELLEKKAVI